MVSPGKPDAGKRILAFIFDIIIALILRSAVIFVLGWLSSSLAHFGGNLLAAGYILVRDGLFFAGKRGASPGKRLLGLRVYIDKGGPCDQANSIQRNLFLSIYFLTGAVAAILSFLSWIILIVGWTAALVLVFMELSKIINDERGIRLGDILAGTHVSQANFPQPPST